MDIIDKIKPTGEEEKALFEKINTFIEKLKELFPEHEIELGGSAAKGTWLKDTFDVDIFIKCENEEQILELRERMLTLSPDIMKGSREYYQVEDDLLFEIVPVLNIDKPEAAQNITDMSPLHTKWVNDNTNEFLKDEIRMCKQFMKAQKVYGAESFIRGFSGYVVEILTIHYGGFYQLLRAAVKWKEKEVIDPSKHHKDVFFEVNNSKLTSPIIVIDPVQPGRNAGAAISNERFERFITAAKNYMADPSDDFFEKKPIEITNDENSLYIKAKPVEGKKDIVGCKVEKAFKFFERELVNHDFDIVEKDWDFEGDILFYFKLKSMTVPEDKEVAGPPLEIERHVEEFKKRYPDNFKKDGRIYGRTKRIITDAKKLVKEHEYLKDKLHSFSL